MEPKLIVTIPCKKIVTPKYRRLLKEKANLTDHAKRELFKEEIMMKRVCERLTENELDKLQI